MEKLVSIIIPVFNRETIVCKTIESVLAQTYRNLEIIIVDDGSTDNSYKECSAYAEKDNRIVLLKKKNGGVSSARNAGLEVLHGEYVFFLDSDDFIYDDAIEKLVRYAGEFSADIIQGNKENRSGNYIGVKKISYLEYLRTDIYVPAVWGKLYKSEILRGVRFDETLIISEDVDFLFTLIGKVGKIICIDNVVIDSIPTETGLNRSKYSKNSLLLITVLEKVIKRLYELEDKEFERYIYRSYACTLFTNYVNLKKYKIDNHRAIRKELQKKYRVAFKNIIKAAKRDIKSKLVCILGWISLDVYRIKV